MQLIGAPPQGYGVGKIDFFTYPGQMVPSAEWEAVDVGNFTADQILSTNVGGSANQALAARFIIKGQTGYIGIGTNSPSHLLHVAGTIGAEEVIVSSTGADYVFEPTYRLRSLAEVKSYINQYHHLPDIPSAEEVSAKGFKVGEIESKLLAKIEELTLHMIHSEEENKNLRERLERIEASTAKAK